MVANNTRYRRSQVGRDLKPYISRYYETEYGNTLFLSLGVISKVQVFQKASLYPISVEQRCLFKAASDDRGAIIRTPAAVSSRFPFN